MGRVVHKFYSLSHTDAVKIIKKIKMRKNKTLFPNASFVYEELSSLDYERTSNGSTNLVRPNKKDRCALTVEWDKL
jgi:hypothetical protein